MITVLGSTGFVGTSLVRWLEARGVPFRAPGREDDPGRTSLDHVVYCIGITGDFRHRRHDTVEAHVCKLERLLEQGDFESLTYLSSTRLYRGGEDPAREENELRVNPSDPDDLYNVSKAMGESLLLASTRPVKVVRLSHAYGLDWGSRSFLSEIVTDAIGKGRVVLRSSPDSERDYVSIDDVVELLVRIATTGTQRIYNVASGRNVTNADVVARLSAVTGCAVAVDPAASTVRFPRISTERITREFGFTPRDVLDDMADLVKLFEVEAGSGS